MDQAPQNQTPQVYDPSSNLASLETIWDRLAKRFGAEDFVRVMNIDDETFYWQALDPRNEQHLKEGNQFMVHENVVRDKPQMFSIPAGATMVLEGWNAMIMIEKLYKKVVAKGEESQPLENGKRYRNFAWQNPERQNRYIDKIFLGIERPTFDSKPQVAAPAPQIKVDDSVAALAKELNLDEPKS